MKKFLLIILIITLLMALCSCSNNSLPESPVYKSPDHGIITWGSNGVFNVEVENYIRISSGWIVINTTDGKQYCTNEKNVLIIREK